MSTMTSLTMTLLLIASGLAMATPVASAHDCRAYEGCDAGGCKDGEDHSHTDMNHWPKRDESCSSKKDPPPAPCVPAILCTVERLVNGRVGILA